MNRARGAALAGLVAGALAAGPAVAQDYVATTGRLTDEAFYRLVACGAPPGGECAMPYVRWSRQQSRQLTVGLDRPQRGYPSDLADRLSVALDRAIAEINGVGSALRLTRALQKPVAADIVVRPLAVSENEHVSGSGVPDLDGEIMGAAFVYVWWNGRNEITQARILMADDLPEGEVYPVLLEELTQSTGFLTDIRNPVYERDSVFSEDSNSVERLGAQDRAAILRHYPAIR